MEKNNSKDLRRLTRRELLELLVEQGQELEYSEESETTDKRKELPKIDGKDTILRRMAQWEFTKEQQEEAQKV